MADVTPNASDDGVFFDAEGDAEGLFLSSGEDHTKLANNAWEVLREDRSQRLSQFVDG